MKKGVLGFDGTPYSLSAINLNNVFFNKKIKKYLKMGEKKENLRIKGVFVSMPNYLKRTPIIGLNNNF